MLEWLEAYRVKVIDRLLDVDRTRATWGVPYLDMYALRRIHPYIVAYAVLLDIFGNVEWHHILVSVAKRMLRLTAREFVPGFHPKFAPAEDKGGVRRIVYQPHLVIPPTASHLASGVFTDGHNLDKDLSDGTAVDLLVTLHANRDLDPETRDVYKDFKDFCYGLWERRAMFTGVFYPRVYDLESRTGDPDFWSKPLNHPSIAFGCANGHMHAMYGGDRFKRAYDRAKAELLADRELVKTPHGPVYVTCHGVQEGYKREQKYRGIPQVGAHQGLQDCTYIGEAVAYAEIANRKGLDLFSDETMAAWGRSVDLCVFYDGYGAKTIGGSIGGGGRAKDGYGTRKRQINLRNGESYPCRWVEPPADFREGMHQLTRNLTTLPMARVMTPEMEAGLRVTLRNVEREESSRLGPRLTLLVAAAERA